MRRVLVGLFVLIISVIFYLLYNFYNFKLFEESEIKLLEELKVPNRNYKVRLYYIPSNATNQSYIQVRAIKDNEEKILESYVRVNYLDNFEILNNDTLKLFIQDTLLNSKVEKKQLILPKFID